MTALFHAFHKEWMLYCEIMGCNTSAQISFCNNLEYRTNNNQIYKYVIFLYL
jgi:hypothetical protein